MAAGEMSSGEYLNFLESICANLAAFTVDGAMHFICMDWRHAKPLLIAGERCLFRAEKHLRVEQGQRRNGVALSLQARADLRV